jgi:hypothetical protein
MLLLWVQRNLHVGPGTAPAQVGYFPIQSVEPIDPVGKSKTCALKWKQSNRRKGCPKGVSGVCTAQASASSNARPRVPTIYAGQICLRKCFYGEMHSFDEVCVNVSEDLLSKRQSHIPDLQ